MTFSNTSNQTTLTVDSRRLWIYVLLGCICIELSLFVLDFTLNHHKIISAKVVRRIFNTAREDSVSSWFAVIQTMIAAGIALLNFIVVRKTNASKWDRIGWLIVVIFFMYMSVDDAAKIHERLGTAAKTFVSTQSAVAAYPSYAWQLVVGPFFVFVGGFILMFLWRRAIYDCDRVLLVSAFTMFGLALAMDYVEGLEDGYDAIVNVSGWSLRTVKHVAKSLEECIEMFGMSLFLALFLRHLTHMTSCIKFQFRSNI